MPGLFLLGNEMTLPGNQFNIPDYLVAPNPKLLRQAMLQNNIKFSMEFQYFDIQFAGKRWYAWFYRSVEDDVVREGKGVE